MQYEMIRYLISGVCTTLVNIGMFSVLRYGMGVGMQAANISSIVAAILFAFVVNKRFVFDTGMEGSRRDAGADDAVCSGYACEDFTADCYYRYELCDQ